MATPRLGLTELVDSQASAWATANGLAFGLESFMLAKVLDRDLNTPPGSPTRGDTYIVGPSPTGAWSGKGGQLTVYNNGWIFAPPVGGLLVFIHDEKAWHGYSSVEAAWHPLQELWSTSEHWTGQYRDSAKVYAKVVDIGAMPAATTKTVAHGITGLDLTRPVTFQASFFASGVIAAPIPLGGNPASADMYADATNVVIFTNIDLSSFNAKLRLTYCKT